MAKSDGINELAAALAKAQGQMATPKKLSKVDVKFKTGGGYSHKYADLAEIIDCIKKPFSDNGLSYIQTLEPKEKVVNLVTTLFHSSGQWIDSIYELPLLGGEITDQVFGASLTYGRRYSLQSISGVEGELDTDGPSQKNEEKREFDKQKQTIQDARIQQVQGSQKPPQKSYPISDYRAEPPPRTQP